MADQIPYNYLLECLGQSHGRRLWLEFKLKARWIDLSTADFTRCALRDYDLSDANLSTAIFQAADLMGIDLSDANLALADLRQADLRRATLDRANLANANLQHADLTDARLDGALLKNARLAQARLTGSDLAGADLTGADLSGANLKYVRLTGARLHGTNVAGADLTGIVMDDEAPAHLLNFDQARIDDRQYRQMRSRRVTDLPAVVNARPAPAPQAEPAKGSDRRSSRADRRARPEPGRRGASPPVAAAEHPGETSDPGLHAYTNPPPFIGGQLDLNSFEGCCAMLEIDVNAPIEEVVRAFRRKAKIYHPDKVRHLSPQLQSLANEEFHRLHHAYEVLTRQTTRSLDGVRWAEGVPRRPSPYDYTSAEYEALARVNPNNPSILYNLGWKYFEEERHFEAREAFERVLAINPDDEDALFNLMIIRLYLEFQLPLLESGGDSK